VLEVEDLSAVNLRGHSHGGMVATGVADGARTRIARLIYSRCVCAGRWQLRLRSAAGRWKTPPSPMPPDAPADDVAWCTLYRMPQPAKTFEQKLKLSNGRFTLPRH